MDRKKENTHNQVTNIIQKKTENMLIKDINAENVKYLNNIDRPDNNFEINNFNGKGSESSMETSTIKQNEDNLVPIENLNFNENDRKYEQEKYDLLENNKDVYTQKLTYSENVPQNIRNRGKSSNIYEKIQQSNINKTEFAMENNKWPVFEEKSKPVNSKDYTSFESSEVAKYPWQLQNKNKAYSHNNFVYHRVTGQPNLPNLNKNPKAYIAVSVIAPKPMDTENIELENELRQLKPWTPNHHLLNVNRWQEQGIRNKEKFSGRL